MTIVSPQKNHVAKYLDWLGDWNPQFLREVKGQLKLKKILTTIAISLVTQLIVVITLLSKLPDLSYRVLEKSSEKVYSAIEQYSRYCTGNIEEKKYLYVHDSFLCHQDMLDNWVINWQLFWFDIFVILSLISIGVLLVLGTYFLVSNAIAEKQKGTLHLVSLSPQSATNILLGKILGVPILLYLLVAITLPLHLIAGLQAHLSLSIIFAFYIAVIASCGFFYSMGLLLSFVLPKSIISWAISIAIALFLAITAVMNTYKSDFHTATIIDWLFLFNPSNLILYIGKTTGIPYHHFDYSDLDLFYTSSFSFEELNYTEPILFSNILFYGQALGTKVAVGISLVIANYSLWTYWIWQGLKRRFYNAENTLISKQQSYWITGYFTVIALGFSLQSTDSDFLFSNIVFLQFLFLFWCLVLAFALSPQRQSLQDWARYRHQLSKKGKILWRELVFGDKSPSTVAIAVNALITTLYVIPALTIFPLGDKTSNIFWGLILSVGTTILLATLIQWWLLGKSKNKNIWAVATVIALTIVPPLISVAVYDRVHYQTALRWFITIFPALAIEDATLSTITLTILGQWLAITFVSFRISRQLRQAGRSETYRIISG